MDLKSLLQKNIVSNENNSGDNSEFATNIEVEQFKKIYNENLKKLSGSSVNYGKIPQFYFDTPANDIIAQKLREDAREVFLQKRTKQLLDSAELNELWELLELHRNAPHGEEKFITYTDFLKVKELADPKCAPFFTAIVFAKLQQGDPHGRIGITALFNYIMRKVWQHQTRIGLSLYDMKGNGYLREHDLENYILELIPTLPQLNGLESSFHSFYVCTAVRKFFFFLDPLRTGHVRIQDVLTSNFLDELLELRDEDIPKKVQESNWFSASSALKVYGQYLNLDRNHNGLISKEELAEYGTGTLTRAFLDRVFQECLTFNGEMDYKAYLDLVLALENRQEPQSLQYLFRILDINNNGYLDAFCFNYFYRAIQDQMRAHGQNPVNFEDVKDEIFDMVKPKHPTKITLKDLLDCGQGDVMISILIDLNGFWTYENREALAGDTGDDEIETTGVNASGSRWPCLNEEVRPIIE